MKKLLSAAALVAALAAAPAAFAGPLDAAFGNTVEVTISGQTSKWRFEPNNTYSVTAADGSVGSGAWEATADGNVCVTPADGGERRCAPGFEGKKPGDSWTMKTPEGEELSLKLVAGR